MSAWRSSRRGSRSSKLSEVAERPARAFSCSSRWGPNTPRLRPRRAGRARRARAPVHARQVDEDHGTRLGRRSVQARRRCSCRRQGDHDGVGVERGTQHRLGLLLGPRRTTASGSRVTSPRRCRTRSRRLFRGRARSGRGRQADLVGPDRLFQRGRRPGGSDRLGQLETLQARPARRSPLHVEVEGLLDEGASFRLVLVGEGSVLAPARPLHPLVAGCPSAGGGGLGLHDSVRAGTEGVATVRSRAIFRPGGAASAGRRPRSRTASRRRCAGPRRSPSASSTSAHSGVPRRSR